MPKITWTGILAFEGVSTNEAGSLGGRFIDPGALEWDTPIPLRIVLSDVGEHKNAVTVGSVDEITREDDGVIRGRGRFDANSPVGLEAARLASEKFKRGISIDPGNADREMRLLDGDGSPLDPRDYESEDDLPPGAHVQDAMTKGRIRGATIVDIPAFEGAMIEQVIVEDDEDKQPDDMVAAAMVHDGGMIALVPSEEDAARLAVDGYEPPEILHLTLAFLGPSADIDPDTRDTIEATARESALASMGPVTGSAWASANFNPTEEPAATYLVGGENMNEVREMAMSILSSVDFALPEQHSPFVPHITIGYGDLDASELDGFGEVTFDRLRVAFGDDDVRDISLDGEQAGSESDESEGSMEPAEGIVAAAVAPHSTPVASKDTDWDGNTAEKALPTGEEPAFYRRFYAFQAPDTDGTAKDHWHYIHHHVSGAGSDAEVGAASLEACHAIIGLLNGARGVDPVAKGADRKAVYDHMAKHMRDGGEDPPSLKNPPEATTAAATPEDTMDSITAAVTGSTDLPIASTDHSWDGPGATSRVFDHFTDGDSIDTDAVARAFLYRDPDADPQTQAAYKLGFADIVDGTLTIIPRGVATVTGGRGLSAAKGIPEDEQSTIRTKVCTLYGKIQSKHEDWPDCPFDSDSDNETASAAAPVQHRPWRTTMPEATPPAALLDPDCDLAELTSLTASAVDIPTLPSSHFDPISFAAPTPLTVDESTGHVYGHVAMSSICHVGYPKCVTMPRSASSLRYFHTGVVRLDDGTDLATGRITVHGAHASLDKDWRSAMAHYDNASTTVADVVAYEDDHGIAVTGHIRPGTPPELVHAFRGSTPSGDWRRIGPAAELINIHMVNSPGFPVYRTEGDRLEATITASATPARFAGDPSEVVNLDHLAAEFGDDIAARVVSILETNREAEQLANEVHVHYELVADNIAKAVRP